MSVVAVGVSQTKIVAQSFLRCDGCGAEQRYDDPLALSRWVCCHKVFTQIAHAPIALPPLVEGQREEIRNDDETHCCPKCWAAIEAFAREHINKLPAAQAAVQG